MRQDEELWMKKMREVLKDYSEPPVPEGWSTVEKELNRVMEKRIRPYVWCAVAAVFVLAVSGISLFFMQTPTADDVRQAMPPVLAATPDVMPDTHESAPVLAEAMPAATITEPIENESEQEEATLILSDKAEIMANDIELEAVQQSSSPSDNRSVVKPSGRDKLHLPVVAEKKRSSDGKWSVGASFSNGSGATTNQTQDYLQMAMDSPYGDGLSSGMIALNGKNELVFDGGVAYLKKTVAIEEIKHKQPVSFGLSVRKNLSNGFSVETGLTYTMLSSEGKSVNKPSLKVEQKLHYIGIPLRGNWDFVESKRFTVYLTAGGMVEKCVYGKIAGDKETIKPLQFSLAGGVGAQLKVTNRIGLYIEPGASYFFDDGSDVETIRKENPLNFNLQGGIRFTY